MDWKNVDRLIAIALEEDLPWGDITSENLIEAEHKSGLVIKAKEDGVIAGMDIARRVFQTLDEAVVWEPFVKDGELISKGTQLARVSGLTVELLKSERLALNIMQRLSGVATITRKYVEEARRSSDAVKIVDTRKTTPGLRYLEKYAVRVGGGFNHRYCLSDAVMIKDNHIAIIESQGKSLKEGIKDLRNRIPHTVMIEMEVDRIDQIQEALEAGVDIILLDNMSCEKLREAVALVNGKAKLEASGGVTLTSVKDIAATGVDYISAGALTHSVKALDISLDYL